MKDTKHADLIAAGIAGLQVAAGQDVPEGGLFFNPNDSHLEGEMKVRVVPLNGSAPYDLTVIASQETRLKDAVQAGLDAIARPAEKPAGPSENPGLN